MKQRVAALVNSSGLIVSFAERRLVQDTQVQNICWREQIEVEDYKERVYGYAYTVSEAVSKLGKTCAWLTVYLSTKCGGLESGQK